VAAVFFFVAAVVVAVVVGVFAAEQVFEVPVSVSPMATVYSM
jgi:hypothetical protein